MTPSDRDERLNARLHHLAIRSPDPARLVDFYSASLGYRFTSHGAGFIGWGPRRCLMIEPGPAEALAFAAYEVGQPEQLAALRARLAQARCETIEPLTDVFEDDAVCLRDPDGNALAFGRARPHDSPADTDAPPARLQHFVIGSRDCARIARFYQHVLGFTLSDNVFDAQRNLTTTFLRCGEEHHDFAVFKASENRLDHHCYEAGGWNLIRDWADRMAARRIPIRWGPGRHGPGNNLFIFVHDPDGNWVEISAELERVSRDRPPGEWVHEERTLNLWGEAPLRSSGPCVDPSRTAPTTSRTRFLQRQCIPSR